MRKWLNASLTQARQLLRRACQRGARPSQRRVEHKTQVLALRAQPLAVDEQPANLRVLTLSASGPGLVAEDNSDQINDMLATYLEEHPRSATVIATEPTDCLLFPAWEFTALLEEHPVIALPIMRALIGRLHRREHHGA